MSIRSIALKTATLFTLATMSFPVAHAAAGIATDVVLTITTPGTISYGEDVAGYAVVTSIDGSPPSGMVTFFDGAVYICSIPVTQTTSCPPSAGTGFAAGTHMLTAVYSGDGTHLGSTSNGVPVTVLPDATTVSLTSSANPATSGQSVVVTATAQGNHAIASGQIEFFDGASLIATATLSPTGVATVSASALTLGPHPLTAVYAATQNFGPATSPVLSEVIQAPAPVATVTTLASNINPATSGQSVTFTADVMTVGQSFVPTGSVTFLDGSTRLGTARLNGSGVATFTTAALGAGSHAIFVNYAGSASAAASSSTPLTEAVNASSITGQGPFTVTVTGAATVDTGRMVNLLVTVAPRAGSIQPVELSRAGLPSESACTFGTATLGQRRNDQPADQHHGSARLRIGDIVLAKCRNALH